MIRAGDGVFMTEASIGVDRTAVGRLQLMATRHPDRVASCDSLRLFGCSRLTGLDASAIQNGITRH